MASAGRILAAVVMVAGFLLLCLVAMVAVKEALLDDKVQQAEEGIAQVQRLAEAAPAMKAAFERELAQAAELTAKVKQYGYISIALSVLALAVVVLAFMKRMVPLLVVVGIGVILSIAFVVMFPAEFRDQSDNVKAMALLFVVTGLAGLGFAKLAANKAQPA
jgi:heme/copper-type cytochrome/quinol oxidase subunit 4